MPTKNIAFPRLARWGPFWNEIFLVRLLSAREAFQGSFAVDVFNTDAGPEPVAPLDPDNQPSVSLVGPIPWNVNSDYTH
jgi:hypothetical protein